MKIVHIETISSSGMFAQSQEWRQIRQQILESVKKVDWPPGSGNFTIYPERKGNGVKPIKNSAISDLVANGWQKEYKLTIDEASQRPGAVDAAYLTGSSVIVFEWETGNISSSHRALNKMTLGIIRKIIIAGVLVVPSRNLYQYLTDRIGNFEELRPYMPVWQEATLRHEGVLEIVVIEQDEESYSVNRIPKGTDGRALR